MKKAVKIVAEILVQERFVVAKTTPALIQAFTQRAEKIVAALDPVYRAETTVLRSALSAILADPSPQARENAELALKATESKK